MVDDNLDNSVNLQSPGDRRQAELARDFERRQAYAKQELQKRIASVKERYGAGLAQMIEAASTAHDDERTIALAAEFLARNIALSSRGWPDSETWRRLSDYSLGEAHKFQEQQRHQEQQVAQRPVFEQKPELSHVEALHQPPVHAQGPDRYAALKETHEHIATETLQEQHARLTRLLEDMGRNSAHYEADLSHYGPLRDTHQNVAARSEPSEPTESSADRDAADAAYTTTGNREMTEAKAAKAAVVRESSETQANRNAISRESPDWWDSGLGGEIDGGRER